jgi:arylsulfatase A-like enzyme
MLRDSGYHIGETYKVWSPGSPNDAPFGAGKYAYEKAGGKFNQFSQNVTKAVESGTTLDAAKQALYDEIKGNFDAFISARPAGQPFLYWFGPTNVHRMWTRGSGKALWGIDPDTLKGKLPKFLPDVPEVREDIADYFGEVLAWDTAVGLLINRLEEMGELDNTLIIMSGDHGPPGFPHGKCNLYDFGVGVSLAMRWGGAKGGRVVDDLVSMTDIAPTLLELAGVARPEVMTGRSLVNVLKSDKSGQVDPQRTAIFTGRERHVDTARAGNLPYPQRAIRTPEYLYIINFHPERTPMGDPLQVATATHAELVNNTRIAFQDMDSGPTKAWLVEHRNEPQWRPFYDRAFAPRPREELYIVADDPDEVHNVAADPKYSKLRGEAEKRLMDELRRSGDPRVIDNGRFFETPPMTDAAPGPAAKKAKKAQ